MNKTDNYHRRDKLAQDLRALSADKFASLLADILTTAGMVEADVSVYHSALMDRLTPAALSPVPTWQEVLGQTQFKSRGPKVEESPRLAGLLEELLDNMPLIPDSNCSCHVSPPCNDCTNYGGLRELIDSARAALKAQESE